MEIQQHRTNWQMVQNLQCHIYVFYFVRVLLIVDAYSKIRKIYGMENITTAEVLDKLDMFQSRFGKIDQFGW